MADAAMVAIATHNGGVNDDTHDRRHEADLEDGDEGLADDGIAVWNKYSAQLDDVWNYEHDEEDASSPRENVHGLDEENLGQDNLITAYNINYDAASDDGFLGSEYTSSMRSPVSGKDSLDGNGSGSGSGPKSLHSKATTREMLPLFTFPILDPSPRPRTGRLWNGTVSRDGLNLPANNLPQHVGASMARDNESFWAVTASLLGPDFDYDAKSIKEQIRINVEPKIQQLTKANHFLFSTTSWPDISASQTESVPVPSATPSYQTDPNVATTRISLSLHETLFSIGQSWNLFTNESSLQLYINTFKGSCDFGVCFLDQDGSRCCCIMRAREIKRLYSLPAAEYWESKESVSKYEFPAPGCKAVFWWCLSHSLSRTQIETQGELDRRYESAKLLIGTFKSGSMNGRVANEELEVAYKRLLVDLLEREKLTGRLSFEVMNTVLQLSDLAELSEMLPEAQKWNYELVSRRSRRLGRDSEHTCHARYKLGSLLLKVGDYDAARDVSRENLRSLHDIPPTNSLVVRQNVQACMIAMKRRRIDQAMDVLPHLWSLERWHENDLRTKDDALSVLVQATLFRHQFVEAEGWIRKRIELFYGQLGERRSSFGDNKHRGAVYHELAMCLNRQDRLDAAVEAARTALKLYQESDFVQKNDEQVCEFYKLLGKLFFDLKEWNKARFYLQKAAHGYTARFGSLDEKSVKARELLRVLEKSMRIRQGLAERLVKDREKAKLKKRF